MLNHISINVYRIVHYVPIAMYQISPKVSTFKEQKHIIPQMRGQESGHNLAECFWLPLSHKVRISVLTERAITVLKWGRAACTFIHVAADQSQIFAGCRSESWITSSHGLSNRSVHNRAVSLSQKEGSQRQEERSKMETTVFFNDLILEVTFKCFYFITFIRSQSLTPALTQCGEGTPQGCE